VYGRPRRLINCDKLGKGVVKVMAEEYRYPLFGPHEPCFTFFRKLRVVKFRREMVLVQNVAFKQVFSRHHHLILTALDF